MRPIQWIGRRSYRGRFVMGRKDILPICIKAGALADNVPRRDLWISPHHAMLLEGLLIEAKDLVNGVSIVQAERIKEVEYFHIELESHDVVVAEGALSESFIDHDNRGMFQNASEYAALYPGSNSPPGRYCATRCEDGYELEMIRSHIALRAGLRRRIISRRSAHCVVVSTALLGGTSRVGRRTSTIPRHRSALTSALAINSSARCWPIAIAKTLNDLDCAADGTASNFYPHAD